MNLDDLSDTPLASTPTLTKDVEAFIEAVDDLLDDGKFQWAADTLIGIRTTVTETGVVTAGQRKAITNIETSVREKEEKVVWSRRYEGMSRDRDRRDR